MSTPSNGGDRVEWGKVVFGCGVAMLAIALLVAVVTRSSAPTATAPTPELRPVVAPTQAEPVPGATPPAPRRTRDEMEAMRIASLSPEQRDGALCLFEGAANPDVTFSLLERSPQRFDRRTWVFNARAIQVQDVPGDAGTFALMSLDTYANQVVAVFTYVRPPDSVVARRRVRVYGRIFGTYEYQTIGGQNRSVPKVLAVAVIPRDEAPRCPRAR